MSLSLLACLLPFHYAIHPHHGRRRKLGCIASIGCRSPPPQMSPNSPVQTTLAWLCWRGCGYGLPQHQQAPSTCMKYWLRWRNAGKPDDHRSIYPDQSIVAITPMWRSNTHSKEKYHSLVALPRLSLPAPHNTATDKDARLARLEFLRPATSPAYSPSSTNTARYTWRGGGLPRQPPNGAIYKYRSSNACRTGDLVFHRRSCSTLNIV